MYEGLDYCELIHLNGAQAVALYDSEFYAGMPAMTMNSYGKGKAYYQAFRDTGTFWDDVVTNILSEAGIKSTVECDIPEGVCVHTREADGVKYLFIQNYTDNAIEQLQLGKTYFDMENEEEIEVVRLDAFDVRVLRTI